MADRQTLRNAQIAMMAYRSVRHRTLDKQRIRRLNEYDPDRRLAHRLRMRVNERWLDDNKDFEEARARTTPELPSRFEEDGVSEEETNDADVYSDKDETLDSGKPSAANRGYKNKQSGRVSSALAGGHTTTLWGRSSVQDVHRKEMFEYLEMCSRSKLYEYCDESTPVFQPRHRFGICLPKFYEGPRSRLGDFIPQ